MWKLDRNALPENEIAARWAMFGPPPVMSSENKDGYDKLRNACVAYYRPTDARQLAWIRELVDTQWDIFRQLRYRTAAIERYHNLRIYNWRKQIDPIIENKNAKFVSFCQPLLSSIFCRKVSGGYRASLRSSRPRSRDSLHLIMPNITSPWDSRPNIWTEWRSGSRTPPRAVIFC